MEPVRRVGIHDDLARHVRRRERLAHALDRIEWDALIGPAVEAEHRRMQ